MTPDDTSVQLKIDADTQGAIKKLTELEEVTNSLGKAFTNAFKGAIIDGKDLESTLQKLALSLSNMALNKALDPLEQTISGAMDGLFGNLFSNGLNARATPFAQGGVVSGPTYFPLAGQASGASMGLMGEAGSEAILPLKRGADGALGVATSGSGASSPMNVTFNISTPDVEGFARSEAQMSAMLARMVSRGRRGL